MAGCTCAGLPGPLAFARLQTRRPLSAGPRVVRKCPHRAAAGFSARELQRRCAALRDARPFAGHPSRQRHRCPTNPVIAAEPHRPAAYRAKYAHGCCPGVDIIMTIGWILGLASLLPQPVADQTCLAATVYLEARSEPVRGQLAVAEVALRRRDQGSYGNTVCEVVTAPHQFALATTPKSFRIDNHDAWNQAWRVAAEAQRIWSLPRAERTVVVPRADHFMRLDASADWAINPLATIGEHRFYAVD